MSSKPGKWHQDPTRPTQQVQDIDRNKNRKVHTVHDARTGDVLLHKDEPLDKAIGRGSDKFNRKHGEPRK